MTQGKHDKVFLEKIHYRVSAVWRASTGKNDNTPSAFGRRKLLAYRKRRLWNFAELMAAKSHNADGRLGIQRQQYGEQKHWMLVTLAAMLGQISLHRAAGLVSLVITPTVATWRVLAAYCQKCLRRLPDRQVGSWWWRNDRGFQSPAVSMRWKIGGKYQHNGKEQTYPNIKMIWWAGSGNFTITGILIVWLKHGRNRRWSSFLNATGPQLQTCEISYYRHPSFERNDLTMTGDYSNQHIVPMSGMSLRNLSARNDFDVFADLCGITQTRRKRDHIPKVKMKMAWLKFFLWCRSERLPMRNAWRCRCLMPSGSKISWSKCAAAKEWTVHSLWWFPRRSGENALGTPSGKKWITPERWKKFGYKDCQHTNRLAPDEWKGTADEQLQLLTAHRHTVYTVSNYAELRKICGCRSWTNHYSHRSAARFGIANGDPLRAWNKRGQILTGAVVTTRIKRRGMRAWRCMARSGKWRVKQWVRTC